MVEGGMKVIKYTIFCFNFLFLVSGIAIIAVGAVAQAKLSPYNDFLDAKFWSPPVLLIVVGCFITMIAFFGCFGAIRESHCMTMTFAVLLGLILILELAAGIAAYVLQGDLNNFVHDTMMNQVKKHYLQPNANATTHFWDVHQIDFQCCGVDDFNDWQYSFFANRSAEYKNSVPDSCCISQAEPMDCGRDQRTAPVKTIYTEGCFEKLRDDIEDNILAIGGVGVGLAFMQLIGVIFACCLARAIRYQYQTV